MSAFRILRRAAAAVRRPAPAQDPLAAIAQTEISRNFVIETENYFLEGFLFAQAGALFITFEHAGGPQERPQKYRPGWGTGFLRAQRRDHIAVKPKRKDWYTRPDLPEILAQLRGLFARYDEVVTYGGSMGGFAALTFADLIGATTVIAIAPQSTLDPCKVPWDNRFPPAQDCDFTGPFGDAVGKFARVARVLVVVDRHCIPDMRHLARLRAGNVHVLNLPFLGHTLAADMQRMGLLAYLVSSISSGTFSKTEFQAMARRRREMPHYLEALHQKVQARPGRVRITAHRLQRLPQALPAVPAG